ncbi:MAG TPA: lactate racemase domain-containing protein [Vicinamibacterales bacterium]|jgi:nickel-dependent lactate racemase|nr:lactate racemase domain-containing protein [Vicinamibacterales bacterium]
MIGKGLADGYLTTDDVARIVRDGLASMPLDGRRVLVIIPDGTRTMPMPLMFDALERELLPRAAALDYLVALGTHAAMDDARLGRLVSRPVFDGRVGSTRIFNHDWSDPVTFAHLGTIPAREIEELTHGRLRENVPVALNRLALEYDHILICGPVFPHEVAGFSGGAKYLFPGIAAPEIIHFTHWLGALITSYEMIGTIDTPVRRVIDRAAALLDRPLSLLAAVVTHEGVAGLFCGDIKDAWRQAAQLSSRRHIVWVEEPYDRVISVMPSLYDDLWTAAKGMYKMEPVVADGGEVVIFAPHVGEISYTHGRMLDEIGYHCRDYFVAQWERFRKYPGGILAHSTHVKGLGTFDGASRVETPRIKVTLATGISPERCERVSLDYLDPDAVDVQDLSGSLGADTLVVPRAGEMLYRVGSPPV